MPRRPAMIEDPPQFVCRETAARRCEISVDTWDEWVRSGYVGPPAIERGQIKRWHWQQVVAQLTRPTAGTDQSDPYIQGVANADKKARERLAS
jgi:hypothetical protein